MKRNIVIIATQKQQKERKKMKGKLQLASVRQIWHDILPRVQWQMEQCGSQTARVFGIWSESRQGALSLTRCGRCGEVWEVCGEVLSAGSEWVTAPWETSITLKDGKMKREQEVEFTACTKLILACRWSVSQSTADKTASDRILTGHLHCVCFLLQFDFRLLK